MVDPGDQLELEPGSVASVFFRWIDAEETVYRANIDRALGADAFDVAYDPTEERATLTYTADADTATDRLRLVRGFPGTGDRADDVLDDHDGTLSVGETIAVPDLPLGSRFTLELDIPTHPAAGIEPRTRLLTYHARPPHLRIIRRADEPPTVRYHGQRPRDASEFAVTYDGGPADIQLADRVDELDPGTEVVLDDAPLGTAIEITWEAPRESLLVAQHMVTPELTVAFDEDIGDGALTIEHRAGEAVPIDELRLAVVGEARQFEVDDGDADGTFTADRRRGGIQRLNESLLRGWSFSFGELRYSMRA